jgi:hypothetical protein
MHEIATLMTVASPPPHVINPRYQRISLSSATSGGVTHALATILAICNTVDPLLTREVPQERYGWYSRKHNRFPVPALAPLPWHGPVVTVLSHLSVCFTGAVVIFSYSV